MMFEESDRVENISDAEEFFRPSPLLNLLQGNHIHPMSDAGFAIDNQYMTPIVCDTCKREIGYGWDAEYSVPQSVFRCKECFDKGSHD